MKLFEKQKLEEVLKNNWTKYINYKLLMNYIVNAVPLYAPNWAILKQFKKNQGNKITISKINLLNDSILLWVDFEVPYQNSVALGTIEIAMKLNGAFETTHISGTIYD